MENVTLALKYAAMGWQVFPCKPREKIPLTAHGVLDATADAEQLKKWWGQTPTANIGVATGKGSGILVLDIDAGHGGEESIQALIKKYGALPVTVIAKTGGGGRHIVFKHDGREVRNSAGKLGKGLDIRGDGGYIVAPPSIHPSGQPYEWLVLPSKTELAVMPEWVYKLVLEAPTAQQAVSGDVFSTGERNDTLTRLAGVMQRRGMTKDAMFAALMTENKARCVPPLKEQEVRSIVDSVSRYASPDAPKMANKDRLQAEWGICKSVYDFPVILSDFAYLAPDNFHDAKLQKFWALCNHGVETTKAASEAGILAEMDAFKDFDQSRVDHYARLVMRFAQMDKVSKYGKELQRAAEAMDDQKIDATIVDITKNVSARTGHRVTNIAVISDEVDAEIDARCKDPRDVWGIPYAFPYLSHLTGGKQAGELVLLAGEPKIGKSWWAYQDALETAIGDTPIFVWSGEMRKKQIVRRMYQLCGLDARRSKTGRMTEDDWQILREAKALLLNIPLYVDDAPLSLGELRAVLTREKVEHGIQQFVLDYAMLIHSPGKDEIERTANVSREVKTICNDLSLAGMLITSVTKAGMDNNGWQKSNVRGSGQQIHDADIVYLLTGYDAAKDDDMEVSPTDIERTVTLHVAAGRDLDHTLPGGVLHYQRINNSPKFRELKQYIDEQAGKDAAAQRWQEQIR